MQSGSPCGLEGQNVKLASNLTNLEIDILTEKDRLAKQYTTKLEDLNSLTLTLNAEVNNDLNAKELDALWGQAKKTGL
jgi:transcription antitermination factor NusA-like protein